MAKRKESNKRRLAEALDDMPIVSIACKKVGVPRSTYYRWREEDPEFRVQCDIALDHGVDNINDLAESKVISGINTGEYRYVTFWLTHRKTIYRSERNKQAEVDAAEAKQRYKSLFKRAREKYKEFLDGGTNLVVNDDQNTED